MVKNPPANARDTEDVDLILGLGRFPGGGNATHCRILAWKVSWTEDSGGLQPVGSQRMGHDRD